MNPHGSWKIGTLRNGVKVLPVRLDRCALGGGVTLSPASQLIADNFQKA